jgi:A/G-specific adenine glycosylase
LFAKKVIQEYDGKVPADPVELRKLPGVGPYTAAAVASIAFHQPCACVDGNVVRVITRLTCEPGDPAESSVRRRIEQWADRLLARTAPGDFNQAMMELGAILCRPKSPACTECPVSRFCCARRRARQESYPRLAPRRPAVALDEWCGVVLRRGRVLLLQRPETSRWAGMWEFPHDRKHGNESVETGLRRTVLRQCGLHIDRVMAAGLVRYTFTHHRFKMRWARCRSLRGAVDPVKHASFRWLPIEELMDFPLSSPHRRIAAVLQQEAVR